jgi:hypothetical protein
VITLFFDRTAVSTPASELSSLVSWRLSILRRCVGVAEIDWLGGLLDIEVVILSILPEFIDNRGVNGRRRVSH